MCQKGGIVIISLLNKPKVFLNDKIARKIMKDDVYGKKITARIISDLLELDYDEVLNSLQKVSEDIAISALTVDNRVDALYSNDKMIIDLEINYKKYPSKPKVLETYIYQLTLSQIKSAKDYNKIKEVVQISIDGYDFFNSNQFIYKAYLTEEYTHQRISDSFIVYHFNLDYLKKVDYNLIKENKLMYDLYFLICGENLLNEIYKGDRFMEEIIQNAKEIAYGTEEPIFKSEEEIMKLDEAFIREQSYHDGIEVGIQTGIQTGINKTIINMHKKKMPIKLIAEYTNLTIDEVKKIISKKE